MIITLLFLSNLSSLIGTIAAIITGLVTIIGILLKPWKYISKFKTTVTEKCNKIDQIYLTLGPNGGTSLYDQITGIKNKLGVLDIRTASLNSHLGVAEWISDHEGHCIEINDIACRVTGRPATDFLGSNWMNVVHEEDRDRVVEEWYDSIKTTKDFISKYRWIKNDGTYVTIHAIAKPIKDTNAKIKGYLGSVVILDT